jgi:hypothetical protein
MPVWTAVPSYMMYAACLILPAGLSLVSSIIEQRNRPAGSHRRGGSRWHVLRGATRRPPLASDPR